MNKTTTPPRIEFLAGVRAELPILFGVLPFGLIYGVAATKAGLSPVIAILMSSVIFAGSAQLITTQLMRLGVPSLVIIVTDAIVNLRHALYSASVGPYTRHLSWLWKITLAYLLTDEAYAVAIARYLKDDARGHRSPSAHWYFLGAGLTLWTAWQLSTIFGVLVGGQVPERWGLDFTLALTFIALTVPVLKDRPTVASAIAAGVVAVLAYGWPYKLGLMAAACAGITVGLLLEGRERRKRAEPAHETTPTASRPNEMLHASPREATQ
jgi:4-azaleucine resistance transporter AzlC